MPFLNKIYRASQGALFQIPPEAAHKMTIKALSCGVVPPAAPITDKALEVELWGRKFPNPIGVAAGFDKNAQVASQLMGLGFGFVETGTVTPRPQSGNPAPRIFRDVKSKSVINRMGFPSEGAIAFKANVEKFLSKHPRPNGVLGINIGMNKGQKDPQKDYCTLIRSLGAMADYLAVNISSPNTKGLRDLQEPATLTKLLDAILRERDASCKNTPLLIKLSPDIDEKQEISISKVLMACGVDGVVLTNTTISRPDFLPQKFSNETGGLSGAPLTGLSTDTIARFYSLTNGRLSIIGAGGVSTASQALDKIKAGASLIQVYTGIVYQGIYIASEINEGLLQHIKASELACISQAVGTA